MNPMCVRMTGWRVIGVICWVWTSRRQRGCAVRACREIGPLTLAVAGRALGDPTRLTLAAALAEPGELCVWIWRG